LSVGLAIFDEDRRLVLFNPALVDLTALPADFLIGRPTLFSVLDRLRDQNMIPEPKDYNSWRAQVAALESAAAQGNYHEMWPLPNGQTFRVTGKPHPNGAIAVLMEDISDEVSLTRKFRSQIDTTTAVIENLTSSVAVFSSSGSLIQLETWQAMSAPSPVWHKLKDALAQHKEQQAWEGSVWLDNHIEVSCYYAPLPDGNHQISFVTVGASIQPSGQIEDVEFGAEHSLQG